MSSDSKRIAVEPVSEVDLEPLISIGTLARRLGISDSALRHYEREGLLIPFRTESGRRLYCRADIARVECIRKRIHEMGMNFEGIRRLLALVPCWELSNCSPEERAACSVPNRDDTPCWAANGRSVSEECRTCKVYRNAPDCISEMKKFLRSVSYE
jgi:MerR family transcriptional regulator/heat shock protein HspR